MQFLCCWFASSSSDTYAIVGSHNVHMSLPSLRFVLLNYWPIVSILYMTRSPSPISRRKADVKWKRRFSWFHAQISKLLQLPVNINAITISLTQRIGLSPAATIDSSHCLELYTRLRYLFLWSGIQPQFRRIYVFACVRAKWTRIERNDERNNVRSWWFSGNRDQNSVSWSFQLGHHS